MQITVPPEILAIASNLANQDNQGTHQPQFIVQQKVEYMADASYNDARTVWRALEGQGGGDASPTRANRLERLYKAGRQLPNWERFTVMDVWEYVAGCVTEAGANDYIQQNGHNLRAPRVIAGGTSGNDEFRALRKFLLSLACGSA